MKRGFRRRRQGPFVSSSPFALFFASLVTFVSFAVDSRADEARTLVEKAIRAHGGEARLARTTIGRLHATGDGMLSGVQPFRITWDETFDLPHGYRLDIDIDRTNGNEPVKWSFAVRGQEAWLRRGSNVPQPYPSFNALPAEGHWHSILLHLLRLRDKGVRLTLLGEEVQDIRSLVGVRAVSRGGTADFYFDKTTGLLARARRPMPHFNPGTELIGENTYEDYRAIDGIQYPMRFKSHSGQKLSIKLQITSLEFLDKIDDREFAKPEAGNTAEAERTEPAPARWDIRLAVAILCMAAVSGSIWLIIRIRKRREERMPQS